MGLDNYKWGNIYEFEVYSILNDKYEDVVYERPVQVNNRQLHIDYFIEDDIEFLDLKGPTYIEVKSNLSYSSYRFLESFSSDLLSQGYNFIIVYYNSFLSVSPTIKEKDNHVRIFISFDEFKKKFKSKKVIKEDSFFNKYSQLDWRENRENIICKAHKSANQNNNAFFLGAGVSRSANMPSWEELLKNLMGEVTYLKSDTLSIFQDLNKHVYEECGESNLIMARFLQEAIRLSKNKKDFSSIIQKYLYSTNHTSELLTMIASIVKSKKVDEILTYNFDDILEQELIRQGLHENYDFTSIAQDANIHGHNTMPIYHVHGIIPENGPSNIVVFSEDVYHERYADIYHWSNIEQLHALTRKHCFFIGLSMVDPNLRRLLDFAKRINRTDSENHFAFLPRKKNESILFVQFKRYMQICSDFRKINR